MSDYYWLDDNFDLSVCDIEISLDTIDLTLHMFKAGKISLGNLIEFIQDELEDLRYVEYERSK